MLVGELLKKYRTEKMKKQKQWVGNVISPSFYAKVEKNIHRITVDDLIELLHYNKISVLDFFSKLERQEQSQNAFKNQIIEAYYHRSKIVAFIYFVSFIALLRTSRNQLFMLFKGIPHIIVIIVYGAITVFCLPLVEKLVGALFSKS